jgi:hypothetical protein
LAIRSAVSVEREARISARSSSKRYKCKKSETRKKVREEEGKKRGKEERRKNMLDEGLVES